jgi:hypothetical protein
MSGSESSRHIEVTKTGAMPIIDTAFKMVTNVEI